MLRTRVVTASVLAVGFGLAAWRLAPPVLVALLCVLTTLAGDEWAQLNRLSRPARVLFALGLASVSIGSLALAAPWIVWLDLALWAWLAGELAAGGRTLAWGWFASPGRRLALGVLVLAGTFRACAAVVLAPHGRAGLWALVLLVSAADIGAYAGGRLFGRHRLALSVSPGKTWEGVAGGLLLSAVIALAWSRVVDGRWRIAWLTVGMATAALSVVGDLTESRAKRIAGVKDSGPWLPGHGGLLDRLDGYTAAAPVYAALSLWLVQR